MRDKRIHLMLAWVVVFVISMACIMHTMRDTSELGRLYQNISKLDLTTIALNNVLSDNSYIKILTYTTKKSNECCYLFKSLLSSFAIAASQVLFHKTITFFLFLVCL